MTQVVQVGNSVYSGCFIIQSSLLYNFYLLRFFYCGSMHAEKQVILLLMEAFFLIV